MFPVAGIVFSFLGFQGVELGGESDNPRRNIPLAVIGSILITAVIYVLLQIAYIAAVQPSDLAKANGWAALSVIIYVLALRSRLAPADCRAQIAGTPIDQPESVAAATPTSSPPTRS